MTHSGQRIAILVATGVRGSTALTSETSFAARAAMQNSDTEFCVVSTGVTSAPQAGIHVALDDAPPSSIDRALRACGVTALAGKLAATPWGRLLNSLGPADRGRVWWRTVRSTAQARDVLRNVDVVIATDIESVKAARHLARRGWAKRALYDPASATFVTAPDDATPGA